MEESQLSEEEKSSLKSQAEIPLLILGAAAFMVAMDARVLDPLLETIVSDFQVPSAKVALAVSAYTLPYGLCQLIYGPLGDRLGKARVMRGAFLCFAIGTAACAFVPQKALGLNWMLLLRFVTGVFAAAIIPLSIATIGDQVAPDKRQATLGQFMSALMMGTVLSGPLGGVFGEFFGWRNLFLVIGIASLVVYWMLWNASSKTLAPKSEGQKAAAIGMGKGYSMVWSNPDAMRVYPAIFLEGLFLFGGLVYVATELQNKFGMKVLYAGLLVSLYGVGGLCYSLTAKRVLKRFTQSQMAILGGSLLCGGFILLALMGICAMWGIAIPALLLMGFGFNSIHSTLQTKATELSAQARGTAVSLFAFFFFLGQALGVQGGSKLAQLSGGKVIKSSYTEVFWVAGAGLLFMAIWVALWLAKKHRQTSTSP